MYKTQLISSLSSWNCILLYQGSMSVVSEKWCQNGTKWIKQKFWFKGTEIKKAVVTKLYGAVQESIFAYWALLLTPPLLLAWVKLFIRLPIANYIVSRSHFNAPFHIISSSYIVKSFHLKVGRRLHTSECKLLSSADDVNVILEKQLDNLRLSVIKYL